MRRGARGGLTDARALLPVSVLAGLLCLGAIVALAVEDAAHPEAVRAPERACRWELAAGTPWRTPSSPARPGGGAAQPVTLLLDQCSGRTWMLVLHGPSFEWRPVRREPEFGFVLERP